MLFLIGLLVVGGLALAAGSAEAKAATPKPPTAWQVTVPQDVARGFYILAVRAYKAGNRTEGDHYRKRASEAFARIGLPKTASAIANRQPLPNDELWPNDPFKRSVRKYIADYRPTQGV